MNTTLIQSQLLILDHFSGRVYFMDGAEVTAAMDKSSLTRSKLDRQTRS